MVVVEVVEFSKFAKKKRPHLFRSISEDASGVSVLLLDSFETTQKKAIFGFLAQTRPSNSAETATSRTERCQGRLVHIWRDFFIGYPADPMTIGGWTAGGGQSSTGHAGRWR